jgi:asparagine synthase (glutamine-hydrolysing)
LDEPIADIAAFGHFAVPKAAAKMGVKVLLTGIGGDEVFWGYTWTIDAVYRNMTNKSGIPQNLNRKQLFNVLKKSCFTIFSIERN